MVTALVVVLLLAVGIAAGWPLIVPSFTYHPERLAAPMARPAVHGLPLATEVEIPTADDVRLHGWWVPAHPAGWPPCDAAAIYFHGNAGNLVTRAGLARALSLRGLDVLLFDYRGFGLSEGRPSESGLRADARAALRYVVVEHGVPATRIVLIGHSLGSAVATRLALDHSTGGLVLGAPFPGLPAAVAHHAPWLPVSLLRWPGGRYEAGSEIGSLSTALLVLVAERDTLVPDSLSEAVFDRAPEPKRRVRVDADHNSLMGHPATWSAIDAFLRERLGCKGQGQE